MAKVPVSFCQKHFGKITKKYQAGIRAELQEMWNCETIEDARKKRDEIIADYRDVAEAAMSCLDEGFESSMTVMALPKNLRRYFRTSNHIERLNKELKRRSSVIGIFPNKNSLMRLMGSVLLERNDVVISKKAIFSPATYAKMIKSEPVAELRKLAEEQQKLRAA